MIAALGIGAYTAAAFHLFTHAFFKALLFLGSGSVIHGMEHGGMHSGEHIDPQDMRQMGGLRTKDARHLLDICGRRLGAFRLPADHRGVLVKG